MSDGLPDRRPVRRIERQAGAAFDAHTWPYRVPAVAQLLHEGLDLSAGVTFLVGENASGKSTLVEAIAIAAGLNSEGGSIHARHATRPSESPLHEVLQLVRSPGAGRWGYFLRAETMHGLYTYLEGVGGGPSLHDMSHGESFLEILAQRFETPGFYVMDEPEAALSFTSNLTLLNLLDRLARNGSQVVCATHSPLLAALPGATILQLDNSGFAPRQWNELDLVDHWRWFLQRPDAYLRHVLD